MSLRSLLSLRTLSIASLLAVTTTAVGCGDDTGAGDDNVTDIKNSDVKKQSIGNCWVYASVGWAESLHLTHSGTELDLSESYLSYWHWFEQVSGGAEGQTQIATLGNNELSTGGWYGVAAELMRRYGVINEGAFIPEEADEARSARQASALAAINKSLKEGALKDAAARRDRALVRRELDEAWQLNPEVRSLLDEVFGADVSHTLYEADRPLPSDGTMRYPSAIEVGQGITLADAIGKPKSNFNVKDRVGPFAWTEKPYPSSASARRAFLREVQVAMHQRLPVIMTWFVDFNAMGADKAFRAPPETPGRQGGHMTVLEDYEIDNVPGFGTLAAGTVVTDQAALDAALLDEAIIKFFRIKNSWGSEIAPQDAGDEFRGYHDLFMEYLNGPIKKCVEVNGDPCGRTVDEKGLWGMVLPPPGFVTGGQGTDGTCHATCTEGDAMNPSCEDPCVATICAQDPFCCDASGGSWDSQCVSQVASICGSSCPAN
jgi:hypothetical protein